MPITTATAARTVTVGADQPVRILARVRPWVECDREHLAPEHRQQYPGTASAAIASHTRSVADTVVMAPKRYWFSEDAARLPAM